MPKDRLKSPLHSLRIVVTRPRHLAVDLCERLQAAGAVALQAPCIEIVDATDKPHWAEQLGDLTRFCAVVFISRNAAIYAQKLWDKLAIPMPQDRVFAVGAKTAQHLQQLGVRHVIYPQHAAGSQALLADPAFADITQGNVLIVRGEGGSETLKDALQARGVRTTYAEVYRREVPSTPLVLKTIPDAIIAASTESLYNLHQIIDPTERPAILTAQLIVASDQAQKVAATLGFKRPAVKANSATDEDMFAALLAWAAQHQA